ncbi:MAG TPA: hypothetical protein DCY94_03205 [Firmicutes bacterium]|nr:hypothetical protein [Bacillota bacterium]
MKAVKQKEEKLKQEKQVQEKPQKPKKEEKPKLTEYEKRKAKIKRQNDLLNMRGIPKFWTILLVEIILIFSVEMIAKLILDTFSFDYSLLRIFLSSCLIATLTTLFSTNLPLKLRRGFMGVINFFVTFYAWLQLGFVNFLGSLMSLGNAEQGTKITDYIGEFLMSFKPVIHLIWIPFILFIIYLVFERYITRDGFEKKIPLKSFINTMAIIVFLALLSFGYYVTLEANFMQNRLQSVSNRNLFKYPSNPALAVKNFGTSVYFILDLKSTILGTGNADFTTSTPNVKNPEPEEDKYARHIDDEAWKNLIKIEENQDLNKLNNFLINRPITPKNDHTGIFEGKNLIMIMMESIGEAVFNEELAEYFPTLHKLYNEGITGSHNYSPRNNCATGDSEMISETSLYSIGTTCTPNTYKNNEYKNSLLYTLRNNGYYTSAYHDYTDQYYYRSTIEYKYGAYRYYGVTDLGMTYNPAYKEWPSDYTFMQKALPKFIDEKRFASYMVSVTAHTPYVYSSEMGNKNISLFKDTSYSTYTKRYLSKVKELDLALEYLLTELETKGILDDTVIVLFGDHYPYGLSNKDYQSIAYYDIEINQDIDRTPFIIYNSETRGEKIDKYTSPIDYAPTLLNLFGVDYDPRYYMGHDVFSEYTDFVAFPDNSWQNKTGFYNAAKGEFIPNAGSTYVDEEIIKINNEIVDLKNMSSLAIKKNYFEYLYKYFDEYAKLKQEKEKQDANEKEADEKDQPNETEE